MNKRYHSKLEHAIREKEAALVLANDTLKEAATTYNQVVRPNAMKSVSVVEQADALRYRAVMDGIDKSASDACEQLAEMLANTGRLRVGMEVTTPRGTKFVRARVKKMLTCEEAAAEILANQAQNKVRKMSISPGALSENVDYYLVELWAENTFLGSPYTAGYTEPCVLPRHRIYAPSLTKLLQPASFNLNGPPQEEGQADPDQHEPSSLKYLAEFMQACEQGKPGFDAACAKLVSQAQQETGAGYVELLTAGLKKTRRICVKCKSKYGGRYDKVLDVLRATAVCDSVAGVMAMINSIRSSDRVDFKRMKNRLHRCFDASESSFYR